MASFDLSELPETRMTPQLLLGVASPLWSYFSAAAVGGVAYWWMTRWTQPANLEAFFGAAAKAPAPLIEAALEPAVEAVEAAVEAAEQVVAAAEPIAAALPEAPVGGEAAPISPLVEAMAPEPDPEPVVEPEPVIEAAPEPVLEAAPEPVAEAAPEPVVETPPEPMMEATAHPLPEPVAKPRPRKMPPANGLEA